MTRAVLRRRRLALVVNNARYLLIPHRTAPNLGSRVLKLALGRLSADWQPKYGHPVLVVESFVDPERFCGTVYTANGWASRWTKAVAASDTPTPGECRASFAGSAMASSWNGARARPSLSTS